MKRFLVILLLLTSCSSILPLLARAQTPTPGPWYMQNVNQFHDRVFGTPQDPVPENEIFGERYTFAQINWIFNSLANIFSLGLSDDNDLINLIRGLVSENRSPGLNEYAKAGIPGLFIGGILETYTNPPASGVDNIQNSLANLKLVPTVSAQGMGFQSIGAFGFLWRASRNTAYFLMVILLVAAGFLIMFRVKINPQTVVSLQLMIPKIILTLILVTFSYAIAGLVIDLIYLVLSVAFLAFQTAGVFPNLQGALRLFGGQNMVLIVLYFIIPTILSLLAPNIAADILGMPQGSFGIHALDALPGTLSAIIFIILAIAICWIMFKVWWMLLKTYLTMCFLVIVGPWQIMLGILPGQAGFSSWFRNLIANASVFVVIPLLIFFTMVLWSPFYESFAQIADALPILAPILLPLGGRLQAGSGSYPILPLVGGGGTIFNFALGYVGLALAPKMAEMIRDSLKIPAFKYGNAIGQPLGWSGSMITRGPLGLGIAQQQAYAKKYGETVDWTQPLGPQQASVDAFNRASQNANMLQRIQGWIESQRR